MAYQVGIAPPNMAMNYQQAPNFQPPQQQQIIAAPVQTKNILGLRQPIQPATQAYSQPVQQAPTIPNIPTGLSGSEQSLSSGLLGSVGSLQQGVSQAQNILMQQAQRGLAAQHRGNIQADIFGNRSLDALNYANNQADIFGNRSLDALAAANNQAQGAISSGLGNINTSIDSGVSALSQFLPQGQKAFDLQAALSGAMGAGAQRTAFSNYQESPEQAYLREQGERAVLQNARAAGGVGGNVLKELQRQGIGMAAQDYGNAFNRLSGMSEIGSNAAGNIGSLRGQQAGLQGSLAQQAAQNASNFGSNQANVLGQMGQMRFDSGSNQANVLNQMGQMRYDRGINENQTMNNMASNIANLISGGSNRAADYAYNTGVNLAQGRTQAGNQIADLMGRESIDLSNLVGSSGSNIAALLSGTGDTINTQQGNLAALLANISTGTGSNAGNQTSVAQFMKQPDYMQQYSNIAGSLGTALDAYGRYQQANQQPKNSFLGGTASNQNNRYANVA